MDDYSNEKDNPSLNHMMSPTYNATGWTSVFTTEEGRQLVKEVAEATVGADIIPVEGDKDWEVKKYKQLYESAKKLIPLKNNKFYQEYLTESFGENGWEVEKCKIGLRIDPKKAWIERLTDEDLKVLHFHHISLDDIVEKGYRMGIADLDDDILIIRSSDASWASLAGREWYYNLKTKEFRQSRIS